MSKTPRSKASAVLKLPQELIADILSFLPVKYLLRFKCVCKSWYSLISSSHFAKLHLSRVKKENNINLRTKLLLPTRSFAHSVDFEVASEEDNYEAIIELNYPVPHLLCPDSLELDVLGSCNGLVCLIQYGRIVLWNPSTRLSKILPNPSTMFYKIDPEPSSSVRYVTFSGLAYDEAADDFKLIVGSRQYDVLDTIVQIFTLKSNRWREIPNLEHDTTTFFALGFFSNQSLYWIDRKQSGMMIEVGIVSFDVVEERFTNILRLPDYVNEEGLRVNLGMSKNRLCVFCNYEGEYLEALVLDGLATRSEEFEVPYNELGGGALIVPVCVTNNGKVVLYCDGFDLALFNPKDSSLTYFRFKEYAPCMPHLYLETLVSPCN